MLPILWLTQWMHLSQKTVCRRSETQRKNTWMILKVSQPLTKKWNALFILKNQYDQHSIWVIIGICKVHFYFIWFSLYELILEPILHVIYLFVGIIVSCVFSVITFWLSLVWISFIMVLISLNLYGLIWNVTSPNTLFQKNPTF